MWDVLQFKPCVSDVSWWNLIFFFLSVSLIVFTDFLNGTNCFTVYHTISCHSILVMFGVFSSIIRLVSFLPYFLQFISNSELYWASWAQRQLNWTENEELERIAFLTWSRITHSKEWEKKTWTPTPIIIQKLGIRAIDPNAHLHTVWCKTE